MERTKIYFISDAHLGAPFKEASEWERQLLRFFRFIEDDAQALYIMGDLFDFWIEYRYAIRADYFSVIHGLRSLIEKGIEIHYFAGNHDFAFGPFISTTLGMKVHAGHDTIQLQGRRVHLYHGDGLLKADVGYRVLKKVLRNRFCQAIYKLLPPGTGIGLAVATSGTSRKLSEGFMTEKIQTEYRSHARLYLDRGDDIVIFGHTHRPELSHWGDKVYCNTGAWMKNFDYATMTGGALRLWRYRDGEAPEERPSIDWNKGSSVS